MKILLTGGTGFLGLALSARLLKAGDSVITLATDPPADWMRAALPDGDIRFEVADVRNASALETAMRAIRPDLVIHAAAATPDGTREAAGDTAAIVAINVGGTANAIEAAARAGIHRVMALSSVAVYGRSLDEAELLSEDMDHRPRNLYAITKSAAEHLALRLGAVHGLSVLTPRVGVLWGEWEHRTGARATPSPVFHMVEAARRGDPIRLPMAATAPLCHVDDVVTMIETLARDGWGDGGVVNLGADRSTDLVALAARIAARFGVESGIDAAAPNVPLFAANRPPMLLNRLAALTGQSFRFADLEDSLDGYLRWLDSVAAPGAPCPRSAAAAAR